MQLHHPRLAAAAVGVALLGGPLAGAAQAHERRNVGPIQFVVGWLNEPSYAGFLNAVQLRVSDPAGPITNLGDAVKVEVAFGDQKVGPLTMAPAFGLPGEYRSAMIPSRPGTYTFRFVGSLQGQQIDQSFTSSDTTFESPKDSAEIQFPVKDPSPAQISGRLERVEPRIDAIGATARREADDASSAANRATFIGIAGLLVGLVGVGLAVGARRRPDSGSAAEVAAVKSAART